MIEAFSYAGLSKKQKVAFVIVPGYAAHLIKFPIFEEIMRDANLYYGRAALRPVLKEETMVDFEFMDYITYYSKQNGKKNNFDILSLAGWENGNTVGKNLKSTKLLVKWLKTLPKMYKDHKLVLLGYSKGAGVVLDVVRESPELRKRIIGYVTYAGVVQGTGIARTAMKTLNELIGDKSLGEIVDKVNEQKGNELFKKLTPLLLSSPTAFYKMPVIKGVLKQFDIEYTPIEKMSKRVMEGLEIRTLMDGAIDLSPLVRTRWNLLYSNNQFFNPGTFIFNLSAITDISTFARPGGIIKNGEKQPNLLAK